MSEQEIRVTALAAAARLEAARMDNNERTMRQPSLTAVVDDAERLAVWITSGVLPGPRR